MDDTSAPATKADVGLIMNEIGKLYMANEQWKDELHEYIDEKAQEAKDHFDVVAENIKHDLWGIHPSATLRASPDKISVLNDRSKNHEERLVVVERQLAI